MIEGVVYRQRKGRVPLQDPAFSHPVSFSGHREKSDNNTISSISNTPRHYRRCLSGSTATQTSKKSSLGPVVPLTTERVARKRLTKPPELELVEYVDSFMKDVARCLRPVRENGASVISGPKGSDPIDAGEFTPKDSRKPTCEQNRASFTKAISLESCFRPMRSREVFVGPNHPIKGEMWIQHTRI